VEEGVYELVLRLGRALAEKGWMLAAAESCTGGLVSSLLTDVAGSSQWFAGSVVAYANTAKRNILGVAPAILDTKGAVSREAVLAMAKGASGIFGADVAMATSGIAGPDGGSPQKPVGTVWMAWDGPFGVEVSRHHFPGPRAQIKAQAARTAIATLLGLVTGAETA
jgi:nicotinamide-nucleotide amidase